MTLPLALLLSAAAWAGSPAVSRRAPRVAIAAFSGENVSTGDAAVAADMLRADLVRTGAVRVIEKAHMDQVLAEQRFQLSGCSSNECAVRLGRLLDAELVGTGSFGKLLGTYILSLRVIGTGTQEVVYADSASGRDLSQLEPAIRAMAARTASYLGSTAWTGAEAAPRAGEAPRPTESLRLAGPPTDTLGAQLGEVVAFALLPADRGALVADASSGAKLVYAWDPQRHMAGALTRLVVRGRVDAVALAPDARTAVTAAQEGGLVVWTIGGENEKPDEFNRRFKTDTRAVYRGRTAVPRWTLAGHAGAISALALSPDAGRLASAGQDGTARIWDLATGRQLQLLGGHGDAVTSVAWSPDGLRLLTGCRDAVVRLWDSRTGRPLQEYLGHALAVNAVLFAPDGASFYSASRDATAKLWSLADGRLLRTFSGHTDAVVSLALSPDGRALLTGSWDRTARLWSTRTGALLKTFAGHMKGIRWESPGSVGFSPGGEWIGVAAGSGVDLWRAEFFVSEAAAR